MALCSAWLLCGACGGKSGSDAQNNAPMGGASSPTGGVASMGGAAWTGGAAPTGGVGIVAGTGGIPSATGGAGVATAGSTYGASGDTSGGVPSGGSTTALSCGKVSCPSLPISCKKIVQDPSACCPICTDTGCDACDAITCDAGTHSETLVGACCATCVIDPPDPCTTSRTNYASSRTSMIEKYGSNGCINSSECTIVPENNLCAVSCGVALPSATANYLVSNLMSVAQSLCSTCLQPPQVDCAQLVAACVNGKCKLAGTS